MSKRKKIAIVTFTILILSLIPIFLISKYNIPYYDDYNHGYLVYQGILHGKSFLECFKLAIEHTINTYYGWQGSYTGIFLSAINPGVFGENLYGIGSVILFIIHIISCFYCCYIVFGKILKSDNYCWIILASIISFFQIQYLPSVQEGFFWWSGAIMHTFGFDLCIVTLAAVMSGIEKKKFSIIRFFILNILIIMCAGCGYEVALFLPVGLISILFTLYAYRKINDKKIFYSIEFEYFVYIIIAIAFLTINIAAPGNTVRAEASGIHVSPVLAIMESFIYSAVHVVEYTSIRTIIPSVLAIYFSYPMIKKINVKFVHPILFTIFMWCIFSTIFTPAIYGENYVASPRYLNVIYFFFYYFIIVESIYIVWYYRDNRYVKQLYELSKSIMSNTKSVLLALLVVFCMGAGVLQLSYTDATSSSAFFDIVLGNANRYEYINNVKFELLNDETINNVVLPKQEAKVRVFCEDNISTDVNEDINKTYARYYMKDSVRTEE